MVALGALAPVFAMLVLGFVMRRARFPGEGFWAPAERVTYFVLFPALIVSTLSGESLRALPCLAMAIVIASAIGAMAAATLLAMHLARWPAEQRGSLLQGAIRMNTYVGIAACQATWGPEGLAYAAVAIAVIVPLVNVLAVATLAWYGARDPTPRAIAGAVFANPLVVACAVGGVLSVSELPVPSVLADTLAILSRGALPLGLLAVGASLHFDRLLEFGVTESLATVGKLVLLPAAGYAVAEALGLEPPASAVVITFLALPTAPSAYLLTKQMGGDAAQMSTLIATQTLLAVLTLPFWLGVGG
ncbi:MAG: AEC family transporter [Planctomycetota bacterium]